MESLGTMIEVRQEGETLVLTPQRDLRQLDYAQIEQESEGMFWLIDDPSIQGVVVDLGRTDYFASAALGLFTRIWRRMKGRGGRMALCNVSAQEKDILTLAGLDRMWPI